MSDHRKTIPKKLKIKKGKIVVVDNRKQNRNMAVI